MKKSFWDVIDIMNKYNVSMRIAAYILGVGRVADSLQTLGKVGRN